MKSNVYGYVYGGYSKSDVFIKDKHYRGQAPAVMHKLIKNYPKHAKVIRELILCNRSFLIRRPNDLFLIKSDKKFISFKDLKEDDFFEIKLTGISDNDIENLYSQGYLEEGDSNNLILAGVAYEASRMEEEKLDIIAEEMLTKMDK